MTIKKQLILFFGPLVTILLILLTAYTQYKAQKEAIDQGYTTALSIAADQSSIIQSSISHIAGFGKTSAAVVANRLSDKKLQRKDINELGKDLALSEKNIFGIGIIIPQFLDTNNEDFKNTDFGNADGNYAMYYFYEGSSLKKRQADEFDGTEYFSPYRTGKNILTTPYKDEATGILMVSLGFPIKQDNKTIGVVVIDISLKNFSTMMETVKIPYKGGIPLVASDKGIVIVHADPSELMGSMKNFNAVDKSKIADEIAAHEIIREKGTRPNGTDLIGLFYPFQVLEGHDPWYFGLVIPRKEVMYEANMNFYQTLGISAVGIILAIATTVIVANRISQSVQKITVFATEISEGNYDATVEDKGFNKELLSLKDSLTVMIKSLLKTMKEATKSKSDAEEGLRKANLAMAEAEKAKLVSEESQKSMIIAAENIENVSNRLSTAAEQLSAQVEESSRSADEQREQVSISVTAMEQMNSTVLDVAQNASRASEGSEKTKLSAEQGADIVRNSIHSIEEVEANVNVLQKEMEGLGQQAQAISTIMVVISDIADQTNLLALNAAIEAARAGEAGRGFAVVADEVRKLAEKTMAATGEVRQAVTGIQQRMERSVSALDITADNIAKSTELVSKSGEALSGIVDEAVISAEQISSIAAAVEEQSASCQHISSSLSDINRISEDVATVMRESSQAVMDLSRQALELEELVNHLRKTE